MGLKSIPAIPFDPTEIPKTFRGLIARKKEFFPAVEGLSDIYTISGVTAPAHEFLFPGMVAGMSKITQPPSGVPASSREAEIQIEAEKPEHFTSRQKGNKKELQRLSLEFPSQYMLGWTHHKDVHRNAQPRLKKMTLSLTDVETANEQFWPTITESGLPYNLIILQKVTSKNIEKWKGIYGTAWNQTLELAAQSNSLFVIDMSIFQHTKPGEVDGCDRVTPSTTTFLIQSRHDKTLRPVSIRVSISDGPDTVYSSGDAAWLYALKAAKVSITVFGIWLGHVYPWHIVTAALQMTMYNTLSRAHPVRDLLEPQSQHLIGFDECLLLQWNAIGPPTSLTTPRKYLALNDHYARGRDYFDDDPKETLRRFGITQSDFTVNKPWDRYPLVGHLLRIWDAVEPYTTAFVNESYPDDKSVTGDSELQSWIRKSGNRNGGNVRGLPEMNSRKALIDVLTSLVFRVTVHGVTRLNPSLNPVQTFIANYPPCLQKTEVPTPDTKLSTKELLAFLPNTGAMGQMAQFYYIFVFSSPYESFLPENGIEDKLFFKGGVDEPRNAALVKFRKDIDEFIHDYDPASPQRFQWPMSVET